MLLSRLFGHSFAVVTDHRKAVPELRDRVRLYGLEGNCRAVDAIDWFVTDMVLDPLTVAKDTYVKVQDVMRTTGAETVVIGCTIVSACYELAALRGRRRARCPVGREPERDGGEAGRDVRRPRTPPGSTGSAGPATTSSTTRHDQEEAAEITGLLNGRSAMGTRRSRPMTSIIVVGGGLVGTATAYFSAREGMDVTLLEQEHTGYGASGRNPGFVWLHCRNPGWALEISLAGRRALRRAADAIFPSRSSSAPRAASSTSRPPSRASCSRSS